MEYKEQIHEPLVVTDIETESLSQEILVSNDMEREGTVHEPSVDNYPGQDLVSQEIFINTDVKHEEVLHRTPVDSDSKRYVERIRPQPVMDRDLKWNTTSHLQDFNNGLKRLLQKTSVDSGIARNGELECPSLKNAIAQSNKSQEKFAYSGTDSYHVGESVVNSRLMRNIKDESFVDSDIKWDCVLHETLPDTDISQSVVSHVSLTDTDIKQCGVSHESLTDTDIKQCGVSHESLTNTDIKQCGVSHESLTDTDIKQCGVSHESLTDTDIKQISVSHESITDIDITQNSVLHESLVDTDIKHSRLINELLTDTDIKQSTILHESLTNTDIKQSSLSHESLTNTDIKQSRLTHEKLKDTDIKQSSLSHESLTDTDIKQSSILHESMADTDRKSIKETSANAQIESRRILLVDTDIKQSSLIHKLLIDTDISQSSILHESLKNTDIKQRGVSHESLTDTDIMQSSLSHESLTDNDIKQSSLTHESLTDTDIKQSSLSHESLTNTDIKHSSLTHESLTDTDIKQNSLSHESLTDNDIKQSSLTHESLTDTDIKQSSLSHESLTNTDTKQSSLTHEKLKDTDIKQSSLSHEPLTDTDIKQSSILHESMADTDRKPIKETSANAQIESRRILQEPLTDNSIKTDIMLQETLSHFYIKTYFTLPRAQSLADSEKEAFGVLETDDSEKLVTNQLTEADCNDKLQHLMVDTDTMHNCLSMRSLADISQHDAFKETLSDDSKLKRENILVKNVKYGNQADNLCMKGKTDINSDPAQDATLAIYDTYKVIKHGENKPIDKDNRFRHHETDESSETSLQNDPIISKTSALFENEKYKRGLCNADTEHTCLSVISKTSPDVLRENIETTKNLLTYTSNNEMNSNMNGCQVIINSYNSDSACPLCITSQHDKSVCLRHSTRTANQDGRLCLYKLNFSSVKPLKLLCYEELSKIRSDRLSSIIDLSSFGSSFSNTNSPSSHNSLSHNFCSCMFSCINTHSDKSYNEYNTCENSNPTILSDITTTKFSLYPESGKRCLTESSMKPDKSRNEVERKLPSKAKKKRRNSKKLKVPLLHDDSDRKMSKFARNISDLTLSEDLTIDSNLVCSICYEVFYKPNQCRPCGHIFCEICLRKISSMKGRENIPCPICRTTIVYCQLDIDLNQHIRNLYPRQYSKRKNDEKMGKVKFTSLPYTHPSPKTPQVIKTLISRRIRAVENNFVNSCNFLSVKHVLFGLSVLIVASCNFCLGVVIFVCCCFVHIYYELKGPRRIR